MGKKHTRTSPATNNHIWDAASVARLTQLWMEGMVTRLIGVHMGLSKNSIVGAAHRLHLPERPSPIKLGGPNPKVRIHRTKESEALRLDKKAETDARAASMAVVVAARRAAAAVASAALRFERKTADELWYAKERPPAPTKTSGLGKTNGIGGRGCMYPMWGDGRPTHEYCKKVQRTGYAYCTKHFLLCTYIPTAGQRPKPPWQSVF